MSSDDSVTTHVTLVYFYFIFFFIQIDSCDPGYPEPLDKQVACTNLARYPRLKEHVQIKSEICAGEHQYIDQ